MQLCGASSLMGSLDCPKYWDMSDLIIEPIDSVYIKVKCERSYAKELSDFFTFKVPGHTFMPTFRNKMWDGQIKLYNIYKQEIYAGLEDYVVQFAKDRSYSFEKSDQPKTNSITPDEVVEFAKALNIPYKLHEHQIEGICHSINNDRCLLLSPTGSGKSLIIYTLIRYYLNKIDANKKILIIVPTISLVTQMYSDFFEYSKSSPWKLRNYCHKIHGGQEKETDKQIVISTWQSIYKMSAEFFKDFHVVIGDECHQFKSKSLTTIMTKLKDCPYRIGTTGTLDGTFTHKLVIEGLFGRVHRVTSTKELMDQDLLSKLSIDCVVLGYPQEVRKDCKKFSYAEELDWLVQNEKRNEFISNLTISLKGNTLVLFQFVEKHGKVLYDMLTKMDKKKIFFVHGGTEADDREIIRKIMEKESNAVIVASYGTFSTGISIKRLHNIVFSSPSKSRIRVLQSIGRQLRKSEFKDKAKLYDIADDLSWKSYKNHTLRHFVERLKIYEHEKFDYRKLIIQLEE
jgi:superfamily II DNA or RNA helicase